MRSLGRLQGVLWLEGKAGGLGGQWVNFCRLSGLGEQGRVRPTVAVWGLWRSGLAGGDRQVDILDMLTFRQAAGHLNLAGARPERLDGD